MSSTGESPAAEAARKRREKLLAKAEARMKLVSGENVSLAESAPSPSSSATLQPASVSTPTKVESGNESTLEAAESPAPAPVVVDNRPKWERAREQNVAAVTERREISADVLNKLDVTQSMAVEAPRAAAAAAERPKHVPVVSRTSMMPFGKMRLDSFLSSVTAIGLGYMSGVTNGAFIAENIWLPLGSFLLFALLFRVILSTSLRRMNLLKPQPVASSGGMLSTALKFLPPPISALMSNVTALTGYFKDSYDDMMLFVFAHGLASTILSAQMHAASAMKAAGGGEEDPEFVSLM